MKTYMLKAGTTGYEQVLTESQARHMLSLWGDQYDLTKCTYQSPISSPSGYSVIYLVSTPMEQYQGA